MVPSSLSAVLIPKLTRTLGGTFAGVPDGEDVDAPPEVEDQEYEECIVETEDSIAALFPLRAALGSLGVGLVESRLYESLLTG